MRARRAHSILRFKQAESARCRARGPLMGHSKKAPHASPRFGGLCAARKGPKSPWEAHGAADTQFQAPIVPTAVSEDA